MIETFLNGRVTQICGDVRAALATLAPDSIDCVVTSPPYWGLRDYGTARWEGGNPTCDHRSPTMREGRNEERTKLAGSAATNSYQLKLAHNSACGKCGAVKIDQQIGLEMSLGEHLAVMVEVFGAVRRVLKPTGTLWLNYGDCYATTPNGRSAAATKAAGNDDRTFRDKPFSTIGPVFQHDDSERQKSRRGRSGNLGNGGVNGIGIPDGRVVAGGFLKAKDLCMIPNRLAIALQDDGWWVRSEIIWHKPNPMPESIRDRPTVSHEKVWLLSKSERYFYDAAAVKEPAADVGRENGRSGRDEDARARPPGSGPRTLARIDYTQKGRNLRNVWSICPASFTDAHFATFPPELAERCIKAGCPADGAVLDPFGGAGTTALVAATLGRTATLIELNPEYCRLARARIEAAFMGKEEGARHMVKRLGKTEGAGPLFAEAP